MTISVLHLIDPLPPSGGAGSLRLMSLVLDALPDLHHDVVLLGGRGDLDLAWRCGVSPTGYIPFPGRAPREVHRALSRLFAEWSRHRSVPLIHAWSARAASISDAALPGRVMLATLGLEAQHALNGAAARRLSHVLKLFPNQPARRAWESAAGPVSDDAVLSPIVVMADGKPAPRDEIRAGWGVHDDETFVIGVLADPIEWTDAMVAVAVASRLAATNRPVRVLIHPASRDRLSAERWIRRIRLQRSVHWTPLVEMPWLAVRGFDAVLHTGTPSMLCPDGTAARVRNVLLGGGVSVSTETSILPVLCAMAAALPIVAERSRSTCGLLSHGDTGFLFDRRDVNVASACFLRLHDDRALAKRIGEQALSSVADYPTPAQYADQVHTLYTRVPTG